MNTKNPLYFSTKVTLQHFKIRETGCVDSTVSNRYESLSRVALMAKWLKTFKR